MRYVSQLLVTILLLTISTLSYAQCAVSVPLLMCDANGDWRVLTSSLEVMGRADTIRPLALAIEWPAPTLGFFIGCNEF
jgi:hypothetical protein